MAANSLDPENKEQYQKKENEWKHARFKTGGMSSSEYAESKRPLANFQAVSQDRVVEVMRKDSADWVSSLTGDEINAIRKYTYNSGDQKPNRFFERLNAMLRGDVDEDEKLRKYADTISKAIKKNRLKRDVIAYRTLDKDVYSGYSKGDIFMDPQFISTSIVQGGALEKQFRVTIYAAKGSSGAYIELLSKFPKQRELLLDKETVFRVISKKENEIELEVIP